LTPPPPTSTLFPYTTLFRSEPSAGAGHIADELKKTGAHVDTVEQNGTLRQILKDKDHNLVGSDFLQYNPKEKYDRIVMNPPFERSEEHTSELQSRENLVCRL